MRLATGLFLGGGSTVAPPPAPVLSSLSYDLADKAGGDAITITGTDLGSALSVTVGGTSATITSNSTTSLTFTMPAKTSGSYNVQVTTAGGASNTLSIEAWSPADLTGLTGWWRASFTSGSWAGQAGKPNLTQDTADIVAGAAVNGKTPAAFSGGSSNFFRGGDSSLYYTAGAASILALVKPTAAPANNATTILLPCIVAQQSSGSIQMAFSASGLRGSCHDAGGYAERTIAATVNDWHRFGLRATGAAFEASVDGSLFASSSVASTGPDNIGTDDLIVGASFSTTNLWTGDALEILTLNAAISDADNAKWIKYTQCRYQV